MHLYQRILHRRKYKTTAKPYEERFFSRIFSGKDEDREHLKSHDHAFFLPTAENAAGRIDHLTVYAEGGFGPDEVAALDAFRQLRFGDGDGLRLMLVGLGRPADFRCSLFESARTWESATPFVVSRHVKKRGQKKDPPECHGLQGRPAFAARVLHEELERLRQRRPELAAAGAIHVAGLEQIGGGVKFRPLAFRRARGKAGDDGMRRQTAAFAVTFPCEVAGPICLGHAMHFGLGLFLPRTERDERPSGTTGGGTPRR